MLEKSWVRQKDLGHGCLGKSNNWAARDYLLLLYGAGDTIFFCGHIFCLIKLCYSFDGSGGNTMIMLKLCTFPTASIHPAFPGLKTDHFNTQYSCKAQFNFGKWSNTFSKELCKNRDRLRYLSLKRLSYCTKCQRCSLQTFCNKIAIFQM